MFTDPTGEYADTIEKGKLLSGTDYGKGENQLNCTTYVQKVLEVSDYDISKDTSRKINIDNIQKDENIEDLLKNDDSRVKGVVSALTSSDQGAEVSVKDLKKGDFIQYWYYDKEGNLRGHAGQISKVYENGKVDIHGSHRGKGGVGTLTNVNLDRMYKVYAVRPDSTVDYVLKQLNRLANSSLNFSNMSKSVFHTTERATDSH